MRAPSPTSPVRVPLRLALLSVALALTTCGGETGTGPAPLPPAAAPLQSLGPLPVLVAPVAGTSVTSDAATFTVRNAAGFTSAEGAHYTFEVFAPTSGREIASTTVAAGASTTSATLTLPRGLNLALRVVARSTSGQAAMSPERFGSAPVTCAATSTGYARALVDFHIPVCARVRNRYANPEAVLGPPDSGGVPGNYFGFVSLGEGGYVTVDMEACAGDGAGPDVRVFQSVGSEPVTLYASGSPAGPFVLVEYRKTCGIRVPGGTGVNRYCDFDLGLGDVREARYFKIEDGELYPCADAGTDSEGADIDAIQILQFRGAATRRVPGS